MEYSPPPLFKQGASARAKVVFFALVSIVLLIVDAHFDALKTVRQIVGTGLYPVQMAVLVPRDAAVKAGSYFVSLSTTQSENEALKRQRIEDAQTLQQASQYLAENVQLRKLLQMRDRLQAPSVAAEILYDARDAFTRKVLLDRGMQHGVAAGQPVLDDSGIVGQVTRVFPFTSEVTLLTDKEQAIPVQVLRNGLRSVAYGRGNAGLLDLRFVPGGADIQKGDLLITSGVDGVYPSGLSVARVADVTHKAGDAFAIITCVPAAGIDRDKHLLILLTQTTLPAQLLMQEERKRDKMGKKPMLEAADKAPPAAGPAPASETTTAAPKPAAADRKAAAASAAGEKKAAATGSADDNKKKTAATKPEEAEKKAAAAKVEDGKKAATPKSAQAEKKAATVKPADAEKKSPAKPATAEKAKPAIKEAPDSAARQAPKPASTAVTREAASPASALSRSASPSSSSGASQ